MATVIKGVFPGITYHAAMQRIGSASTLEGNPRMRFSTRIFRGTFDGIYRDERISVRSNQPLERVCPKNKCEPLFKALENTGVSIETYGITIGEGTASLSIGAISLGLPPKCSSPEKINAYHITIGDRESAGGATLLSSDPELATKVHTKLVKKYNELGSPERAINWLVNKSGFPVKVLNDYPNFFNSSRTEIKTRKRSA